MELWLRLRLRLLRRLFRSRDRDARSESPRSMEWHVFLLPAAIADSRPTSCEINRSARLPNGGRRSNRGIFFWRRNNKADRKTRSDAPDASAANESIAPEFPFADYRRQSLCQGIRRDT